MIHDAFDIKNSKKNNIVNILSKLCKNNEKVNNYAQQLIFNVFFLGKSSMGIDITHCKEYGDEILSKIRSVITQQLNKEIAPGNNDTENINKEDENEAACFLYSSVLQQNNSIYKELQESNNLLDVGEILNCLKKSQDKMCVGITNILLTYLKLNHGNFTLEKQIILKSLKSDSPEDSEQKKYLDDMIEIIKEYIENESIVKCDSLTCQYLKIIEFLLHFNYLETKDIKYKVQIKNKETKECSVSFLMVLFEFIMEYLNKENNDEDFLEDLEVKNRMVLSEGTTQLLSKTLPKLRILYIKTRSFMLSAWCKKLYHIC